MAHMICLLVHGPRYFVDGWIGKNISNASRNLLFFSSVRTKILLTVNNFAVRAQLAWTYLLTMRLPSLLQS